MKPSAGPSKGCGPVLTGRGPTELALRHTRGLCPAWARSISSPPLRSVGLGLRGQGDRSQTPLAERRDGKKKRLVARPAHRALGGGPGSPTAGNVKTQTCCVSLTPVSCSMTEAGLRLCPGHAGEGHGVSPTIFTSPLPRGAPSSEKGGDFFSPRALPS